MNSIHCSRCGEELQYPVMIDGIPYGFVCAEKMSGGKAPRKSKVRFIGFKRNQTDARDYMREWKRQYMVPPVAKISDVPAMAQELALHFPANKGWEIRIEREIDGRIPVLEDPAKDEPDGLSAD